MTKRKPSQRGKYKRSRNKLPIVTGTPISETDLLAQSTLAGGAFAYAKQSHLIPGAERVSGKGSERSGAQFTYRTGHLRYCRIVAQVLAADGSYTLAALRLLVSRLPFERDGMKWIRRALIDVTVRRHGEQMTVGSLRRAMRSRRVTAGRVTQAASQPIGLSSQERERDARHLTQTAGLLSPAHNPAGGMPHAQAQRAAIARITLGRRLSEDEGLPDLSVLRVLDILRNAPTDVLYQAYEDARKWLVLNAKPVNEMLRRTPQLAGQSDTEIVETVLPYPGIFQGVRPLDATLPAMTVIRLLWLCGLVSAAEADALGALLDLQPPSTPFQELPATSTLLPATASSADRSANRTALPAPANHHVVESEVGLT